MSDYQDFEQRIAPEIEKYVGTPQVNADEISSHFPGAYNAIDLVNQYDSSLLRNVAFIVNSDESGSFGIFNPSLNKTIDWIRVQKELNERGYTTDIPTRPGENDKLYAYHPEKSAEEVTAEMQRIFDEKESEGGNVIGINVKRILSAADQMIGAQGSQNLTPEQAENLKTSQLASIIAHEATHALGGDEGTCQKVQNNVLQFGLKSFDIPMELTGDIIHASEKGWYKKAQILPFQAKATEPHLRIHQEFNSRLFPVEKDPNDSLETLLVKNIHDSDNVESKTLEGNLGSERKELDVIDIKPVTTEELLVRLQTKPLILPIPKSSQLISSNVKTAAWSSNFGGPHIGGLFGYMNGFNDAWRHPFDAKEISDRPGMDNPDQRYWDRRYNQMFNPGSFKRDRFGRLEWQNDAYIDLSKPEFRREPTLWSDRPSAWPGRPDIAVAQTIEKPDDEKNCVIRVLRKIGYLKNEIINGKRPAVRLIVSSDALNYALSAVSDFPYMLFSTPNEGKHVLWLTGKTDTRKIKEIEEKLNSGGDLSEINDFVGLDNRIKENVNKILSKCKVIAMIHGLKNVFVVGGFSRTLATTKNMLEVNDLDFTSPSPDDCLKLGGFLAEELGKYEVGYHHRTNTMTFEYDGLGMDFRGKFVPYDVTTLLHEFGIPATPLNFDIYARDYTINSLLYSFMDNKIYDVTGRAMDDIKKRVLVTFFPPERVIPANPILITRGIILNMKGFIIPEELDAAMKEYSSELFNGELSEKRLAYEYEKMSGYEDCDYMLKEYGLQKLKEIRDKVAIEQPELFGEN